MTDVTQMLEAIGRGEKQVTEELFPLLYDELRKLAANRLAKEKPDQTLQATALVHEVYMRLVGGEQTDWQNRAHFFAAAAEVMRRILIDRARQKKSLKHGGDRERLELMDVDLIISIPTEQLLEVNEALDLLAEEAPMTAQVVKLRCFAGLPMEDIAAALDVSRTLNTNRRKKTARSMPPSKGVTPSKTIKPITNRPRRFSEHRLRLRFAFFESKMIERET